MNYLRKNKRVLLSGLRLSGKLGDHLAGIDKQAEETFDRRTKQMAEREGMTEQRKAADQMAQIGRMNDIQDRATEAVNAEIIYS